MPFNSIRRSMRRWRQLTTPNIPHSLQELSTILNSGEWPRYSNCTSGLFFSGSVDVEDSHAIIFGNNNFLGNFRDSQYTFIDATFKAVPRRPRFYQILTIFGTCMDHVSLSVFFFIKVVFHYIPIKYLSYYNIADKT